MSSDVGMVMPVYRQHDRFLRLALQSVLHQSYRKFRLVIVLDGSPTHTKRLVRRLVHGDRRVRIVSMPKNRGIAAALNRGFQRLYRHSHIRYLTWVSSDNIYHRNFLYDLRKTMRRQSTHVGLVYSGFGFIDNQGKNLFDTQGEQNHMGWMNQPKEALLDFCFIGASYLYKRRHAEKVGSYGCEPVEDYDFWLRLTEHCDIHYLPKSLVDYRVNSEFSLSRQLHSSVHRHRLWRYSFERTKYDARQRRGIPPDVTVIVPITNQPANLAAHLETLYEQTFSNMQILLFDLAPGSHNSRSAHRLRDPRATWLEATGHDLHSVACLGLTQAAAPNVTIYPGYQALSPNHVQVLLDNYRAGSASGEAVTLETLRGQVQFPPYIAWEHAVYQTHMLGQLADHL